MVSRAIENAQKRVEGYNFDIRKNLLEYDDVANDQRKVIYQQRFELLKADEISNTIKELRAEALTDMIQQYIPPQSLEEQWNIPGLEQRIAEDFGIHLDITKWLEEDEHLHEETLHQRILDEVDQQYQVKEQQSDVNSLRDAEKMIMLQVLDNHWKEHLASMDHLRQGIHLRGYAQKNPTQEFKRESFELFKNMLGRIKYEVVSTLSRVELVDPQRLEEPKMQMPMNLTYRHEEANLFAPNGSAETENAAEVETADQRPFTRTEPKVGRNELCPCGSGIKYKQCHGKLGQQ
jgi:preprotein translocase subunit SecA